MNILAVGAHPDDIEICCSGALAKYAHDGHKIGMAIMTDGATGSSKIPANELIHIREEEARKSAKVIGAELFWLGFPDGKLEYEVNVRLELNKVIRKFVPDIIITHNPEDYISDHRITSKLVVDSGLWAHVDSLIPEVKGTPNVASIIFMEPLAGVGFVPERYVDITDYFEIKKRMLMCHESQQSWLKDYGEIDYLELIQVCARFRGIQSGVQYAESYKIWHGWQTTKCEPVLP